MSILVCAMLLLDMSTASNPILYLCTVFIALSSALLERGVPLSTPMLTSDFLEVSQPVL